MFYRLKLAGLIIHNPYLHPIEPRMHPLPNVYWYLLNGSGRQPEIKWIKKDYFSIWEKPKVWMVQLPKNPVWRGVYTYFQAVCMVSFTVIFIIILRTFRWESYPFSQLWEDSGNSILWGWILSLLAKCEISFWLCRNWR